ncbi:hypothetical protein F5Y15DRAFT_396733 [Xylariaceae sp. FL0016]|nr:hypothetical protein F5Y15DRAFT_396733 [Xylariaceae sp. FL0016]
MPRPRVELVPWDHESEAHVQRMVLQRKACGWGAEEVPLWKERSGMGLKSLFWVVLADDSGDHDAMLELHLARFPNETASLLDSAMTMNLEHRTPSEKSFAPIGHVALNKNPTPDLEPYIEELQGDDVFWIASLYISQALQSKGLGRSVMAHLEELVTRAPLNGQAVALDTVQRDFQVSTLAEEKWWKPMGLPMPKVSNQDWYLRQGYEMIKVLEKIRTVVAPTGEPIVITLILLKKDLVPRR